MTRKERRKIFHATHNLFFGGERFRVIRHANGKSWITVNGEVFDPRSIITPIKKVKHVLDRHQEMV